MFICHESVSAKAKYCTVLFLFASKLPFSVSIGWKPKCGPRKQIEQKHNSSPFPFFPPIIPIPAFVLVRNRGDNQESFIFPIYMVISLVVVLHCQLNVVGFVNDFRRCYKRLYDADKNHKQEKRCRL